LFFLTPSLSFDLHTFTITATDSGGNQLTVNVIANVVLNNTLSNINTALGGNSTSSNATLTDTASTAATALNTLDGKVGSLTASSIATVTGNYSDLNTCISNVSLGVSVAVTVADTVTAGNLNTFSANVGNITLSTNTISSSSRSNLTTLANNGLQSSTSVNVTVSDTALTPSQINTLDTTYGNVDASAVVTLSSDTFLILILTIVLVLLQDQQTKLLPLVMPSL